MARRKTVFVTVMIILPLRFNFAAYVLAGGVPETKGSLVLARIPADRA
jgi:hypothetical protein